MWKNMQSRIPRPAWMALAIVLILAVSLSFAPVRAIANNFLGLFRVEQIQVVEVDYSNLSSQLGDSSQIENFLSQNVQVDEGGGIQEVADAQAAAQMTGLDVRVISGFDGPVTFRVQPAAKAVTSSRVGRDGWAPPATRKSPMVVSPFSRRWVQLTIISVFELPTTTIMSVSLADQDKGCGGSNRRANENPVESGELLKLCQNITTTGIGCQNKNEISFACRIELRNY